MPGWSEHTGGRSQLAANRDCLLSVRPPIAADGMAVPHRLRATWLVSSSIYEDIRQEETMRHLISIYLMSNHLSRRGPFKALPGLEFTATAAQSLVTPLKASENGHGATEITGTGGQFVVAQTRATGVEFRAFDTRNGKVLFEH